MVTAVGMFACPLAQAGEPQTLREGMGNILFTIIFILLAIAVAIWWMKRNYG